MIVLFDYDSFIYKCSYRIVDIAQIRRWFEAGRTKEWMAEQIVKRSINRLAKSGDELFEEMEDVGIKIDHIEYYITAARKSIRKELYPAYKANRKRNKWVSKVRAALLSSQFAVTSDEFEADDLIYDRAMDLEESEYVVLTMDKDLKQIPGIHFDYYRKPNQGDEPGKEPCRGLDVVSEDQATRFFWYQMLTGDHGDNIKGVHGIGPKRAEKILDGKPTEELETIVAATYYKKAGDNWIEEFKKNYFLLKLGTKQREYPISEQREIAA